MRRSPLHLARPSENDGEFDVFETYDIAYGFFEVAKELWHLAGRNDQAEAVQDILRRAYRNTPPRLTRDQIVALRDTLVGLEDALTGTVIDHGRLLSMEQVDELRGRTDILDLDPSRGELAREAVSEALAYVDHLREIASEALENGADILFD